MEYILDYSKWRSGGSGPWRVGFGVTQMLNDEGYYCCLGQFAKQVGVTDDFLLNKESPALVSDRAGPYDSNFVEEWLGEGIGSTELAYSLMYTNDALELTPGERIKAIRENLEKHGHTLKVINAPDGIE